MARRTIALLGYTSAIFMVAFTSTGAFSVIYNASRNETLIDVAAAIDRGDKVDQAGIESAYLSLMDLASSDVCDNDTIQSGLTVTLKIADTRLYADVSNTVSRLQQEPLEFASHALRCYPTDGNIWVRFAMLKYEVRAPVTEVLELATMSQTLAPSERRAINGRLALLSKPRFQDVDFANFIYEKDFNLIERRLN